MSDVTQTKVHIPLLHEMQPWGQEVALAYYEAGVKVGWGDGYQAAENDMAALQRQAVASARAAANNPNFTELCHRRGDHQRAHRQQQIMKERGLVA